MKSWILVQVCSGLTQDQLRVQTVVGPDGRIEPSPAALAEQMRKDAWDFHVIGHHDAVVSVARRRQDPQERRPDSQEPTQDSKARPADVLVEPDVEDPALKVALEHYLTSEQDREAEGGPPRRMPALMSQPAQTKAGAPRVVDSFESAHGSAKVLHESTAGTNTRAAHKPLMIDDLITRRKENDIGLGHAPVEAPADGESADGTSGSESGEAPSDQSADHISDEATSASSAAVASGNSAPASNSDEVFPTQNQRDAVVRITAMQPTCMEVHLPGPDACAGGQEVFGSGFFLSVPKFGACQNDRILLITNHHVVGDAQKVTFEMPAISGKEEYDATVISYIREWDIAVLDITDETRAQIEAKAKAIGHAGAPSLELALDSEPLSYVNEKVMSMTYPLATDSLVVSSGRRSGHEIVFDMYAYEFDASISSGSSGGALAREKDGKVIGITFASVQSKDGDAESLNFAIPAFRVSTLLKSVFCADGPDAPPPPTVSKCQGPGILECEWKVAEINAVYQEGSEDLYKRHKCDTGVYLQEVLPESIYSTAEPPLPSVNGKPPRDIFITHIRGARIDGMGFVKPSAVFADDAMVPLNDALFFVDSRPSAGEDIGTLVEIEICTSGQTSKHKIDLRDGPRYELSIETVDQPNLNVLYYGSAATKIQAERFGRVVIRPAGVATAQECVDKHHKMYKHVSLLEAAEENSLYLEKPALVIVETPDPGYPQAEGYVHSMSPCDIVKSLNGKPVSTFQEFFDSYVPEGDEPWTLVTTRDIAFEAEYKSTLTEMLEELKVGRILTPIAHRAAIDAGLDVDLAIENAENTQAADQDDEDPSLLEKNMTLQEPNADGIDVVEAKVEKPRPKIPAAVSLLNTVEAAAEIALLGDSDQDQQRRAQLHHLTLQQTKRGHSKFWRDYRKARGVHVSQRASYAMDV